MYLLAKCEDLEVENGKLREQVKTLTENQKGLFAIILSTQFLHLGI